MRNAMPKKMPSPPLRALEIATCQLNTALALFLGEKDYISALTLAGAAEEILGHAVKSQGKSNALRNYLHAAQGVSEIFGDDPFNAKREIREINFARNMAKHINPVKVPAWFVNPREEAQYMLYRAISNYRTLGEPVSDQMQSFLEMLEDE